MKKLIRKIKWNKIIKFLIFIMILAVAGVFAYRHFFAGKTAVTTAKTGTFEKVETGKTIQNILSGSGTIQPLNTYDVTTLVSGEVIAADFKEGDMVEKGQVLYKISTDDVDSQVKSSQTKADRAKEAVTKAEKNYADAQDKYNDAVTDYKKAKEKYSIADMKSTEAGIVKVLYVKEGDTVQNGAQIAEIYDNSYMLLTIPFSSSEVSEALIGKTAKVTIGDSFETIDGKVTKISKIDETLSGNRVVKEVTIQVKNPGGITGTSTATAVIGSISSTSAGTFSVLTDKVITADIVGEIGTLNIKEGDSINEGDVIFTLTNDSIDDQLKSYSNAVDTAKASVDNAKDGIETAKESLEDAESSLDNTIDAKTDYSITAPISGKIVDKAVLVGDTISVQNSSTLCTIYDLSAVTFSMDVDELDIGEVKVGDSVNVTADALENTKITGKVTNISLISNADSGVTQYPVTVEIDDVGDLLPGMNVTGDIVVEEAADCIAIPSDALRRGNLVYVKDASVTEANGDVPAGCKAVKVETGLTDGNYIQIKSGLSGTEEVYVERNVSSESATKDNSLLDGLGFGGNQGGMPSGGFPSGGFPGGGNMGGRNQGGGMPGGNGNGR